jgi:hypothetical protein
MQTAPAAAAGSLIAPVESAAKEQKDSEKFVEWQAGQEGKFDEARRGGEEADWIGERIFKGK